MTPIRILLVVLFAISVVAGGMPSASTPPHGPPARSVASAANPAEIRAAEVVSAASEQASVSSGRSSGHEAVPRSHCDIHCPQLRVDASDEARERDWRIVDQAGSAASPMDGIEPPVPIGPPRSL